MCGQADPRLVYDLTVETGREHALSGPPVDRKGTQSPHFKVTVDIAPMLSAHLTFALRMPRNSLQHPGTLLPTILAPLVKSAFPWASALKPVI